MMAEQLKILANIDPLSIDQTIMTNHASLEAEYPAYRTALNKDKTGNAFVLKSSKMNIRFLVTTKIKSICK